MAAATPGDATGRTGVPVLEMRNITKRFPGVVANNKVDFDVRAGEVHTLFGENGAGKSTLMRVVYGLYRPDEGEIRINGQRVSIGSPSSAIHHGIGMIHQHFMLVDTLTVAENVALGTRSTRGPLTGLDTVSARIVELSERYGLKVDPQALIWQLSVGERQRVEIIKALYRDVELLILDEPTAVLTPTEVGDLFTVLRQMATRRPRARLHLAQGPRGARPVRPHHRPAERPHRRDAARGRGDPGAARRDDGRPPGRRRGASTHGRGRRAATGREGSPRRERPGNRGRARRQLRGQLGRAGGDRGGRRQRAARAGRGDRRSAATR